MQTPRIFDEALSHCDTANVLDALVVGIAMLDAQLCLTYANPSALQLLSIAPERARGRPFLSLFRDAPAVEASLKAVMESGLQRSMANVQLVSEQGSARDEAERFSLEIRPVDGFTTGIHLLLQLAGAQGPDIPVQGRGWTACSQSAHAELQ